MSWIEMTDGDITLTRLAGYAAWSAFHGALVNDIKLYDVATGYARKITYESLQEYVQKGKLSAWFITRGHNPDPIGYGIYSGYTGTQDVYIYRMDGVWDGPLVQQGIELLTGEVFDQFADCERVFTYLPTPLPPDAEELLYDMGFDPWKNSRDRGVKRTFALERSTWRAYHPTG